MEKGLEFYSSSITDNTSFSPLGEEPICVKQVFGLFFWVSITNVTALAR